jgi:hypothetical protein
MKEDCGLVSAVPLSLQVKSLPVQAHSVVLDSPLLANQANREGMHANALTLTRLGSDLMSRLAAAIQAYAHYSSQSAKWQLGFTDR